jgi:hypothetical protein
MSVLAVQLNHPGSEKSFKKGNSYSYYNNQLIREWNNDKYHYRKFIRLQGKYISAFDSEPINDELLFWGEWEGNSWFQELPGINPNGIHRPFHSSHIHGHQNTDPYVYGEQFYYAICKQRGQLTKLDVGSIILFGSSFKEGFVLDTVFVVDRHETAHEVAAKGGMNYSNTYREATLEQLAYFYANPEPASPIKLYSGKMHNDKQQPFSYVPCKPYNEENAKGFKRVIFPYETINDLQFSSNPTGIKIIGLGNEVTKNLWNQITNEVLKQGFSLGIFFNEPQY